MIRIGENMQKIQMRANLKTIQIKKNIYLRVVIEASLMI